SVLSDMGEVENALAAHRKGLAIRQRLAGSDEENTQWQRDLAISYEKIGDALQAAGKLNEALASYREELAVVEHLVALEREDPRWQSDLQIVIGRIGGIAYRFVLIRDFETALQAADQAISLAPAKTWLYTNRAHALMLLGHVEEARALYLRHRGTKKVQ